MLSTVGRRALRGIRSPWAKVARNVFPSSVHRPQTTILCSQYQLTSSFWSKKEDPEGKDKATTDKQNPTEGSEDGSIKKQEGNKAETSSEKSLFDQYVDPKVLDAPQQLLSSLWTTKEDPKKDDTKKSDKNKKDDEESTYSRIFDLWDRYQMAVAVLGIAGLIAIFFAPGETPKDYLFNENECEAKVLADAAPGTHPGSDHIKRVKMNHRLSIDALVKNGVGHAELEGTLWTCKTPNSFSYSYPEKVYQQKYWNDEAAYELTPEAAEKLRLATEELHAMCLEAVDIVVASDDLLTLFEIPPNMWEEVRRSWRARERDFLGRFDFMWDGRGEPKLAEYNADTPTILVETAVGQSMWSTMMHQHHPNGFGWTFNALEQQITDALSGFLLQFLSKATTERSMDKLHFAGVYESVEEREHLRYLAKLAREVGFTAQMVDMAHLDVVMGRVVATKLQAGSIPTAVDNEGYEMIDTIFKLYPYEWLAHENVGREAFRESNVNGNDNDIISTKFPRTRWIEPAWKLILGNKAILAVLWQRFPGHPNLLPAYFELPDDATSFESGFNDSTTNNDSSTQRTRGIGYVAKPKFGREGQGIVYGHKYTYASDFVTAAEQQIYSGYTATTSSSDGSSGGSNHDNGVYLGYPVYQQYFETATFSMRHIVIGSWVVGGVPSGFNFREDSTATTQDSSCFVPHYITGASRQKEFVTVRGHGFNAVQKQLYKDLYDVQLTKEMPPASSGGGHAGHRSGGGGGGGGWGWFRTAKDIAEMKEREEKEKKEKEEKEKKAKEEKERKDREEREKKQGTDKDKDKDKTQTKQDTKQDPTQKAKDTSNKATAERFCTKRSQAGGHPMHHPHHHHHPSRATGSSYKAAKASASRGGSGRAG